MTDPDLTFADLHRAIGGRLFTVTVVDRAAGLARRAYTSDAVAYPVSGTKPLTRDRWGEAVLIRGETFVANTHTAFADVFFDYETIVALGCESALNLPVKDGGSVLGTVNVLDIAGHFTPDRVAEIEAAVAARHGPVVAAMRAVPMG